MSIQYAILGLLNWKPLSGYDLKKMIAESTALYWSGNSNQVYRTLVKLYEQEWVTYEIQQQENAPAKKVYSISEQGRSALREWVLSAPEPLELRNTFLVQLAWAHSISDTELRNLLDRYEEEVRIQLAMQTEKARRGSLNPQRTPREAFLWRMISENLVSVYENELRWVQDVRTGLNELGEELG